MINSEINSDVVLTDFLDDPDQAGVLQFLVEWVSESVEAAHDHVADHYQGQGSTLIARLDQAVAGLVTLRWTSRNPAFAERDIPLVHQLMVAPRFRRQAIATTLMDAAEDLAARRGRKAVGITVGLFDEYGPAQRLYAKRGYLPDGRGACQGLTPLHEGQPVTMDHTLILWLTKDLTNLAAPSGADS